MTNELAEATKKLYVAPDDLTKPALIDHLFAAQRHVVLNPNEPLMEYASLQIFADEFGVFCPAHDLAFLSSMNKLWDNRMSFKESRRGRGIENDLKVTNPSANMVAGTQPDFLANWLPPEAWGMGFMSRMIMVYSGTAPKIKLFGKTKPIPKNEFVHDLKAICELQGEFDWSDDAADCLTEWHAGGMQPIPEHTKLQHYLPRRIVNTVKLCCVSSAARSDSMVIELQDVQRARDWLLEVEGLIPEIFKALSGVNDYQVMQELHFYVWELWVKGNKKPLHISRAHIFLAAKVPSYSVTHIMKTCFSAGILKDLGADLFEPGTQNNLRME